MNTLPPNPRPEMPMLSSTLVEVANAMSELKNSFHEKQVIIDEIGRHVPGNTHLTLCNLQSKAFKAVETIEEYQVANCPAALVDRLRKGAFTLSKVWDIFSNSFDDDTVSTAVRAVGLIAKENVAPLTKDAIIDAGLVSAIVQVLVMGSMRQRCYSANAIVQLSHKDTRAKKAIVAVKGAVKALASLLCHGVACNIGPAKRDAMAALCNLANTENVPIAIVNSTGTIEAMLDILSHNPVEADKDSMEITLVTMSRLCKACKHFQKNLQDREVHFKLVPLVKGAASAYINKHKHGIRGEAACLLAQVMKGKVDDVDSIMSEGFAGTVEGLMHMAGYGSEYEQSCALDAMREIIKVEKYNHFSEKLMGEPHKVVELCMKLLRVGEMNHASTMAAGLLKSLAHHKENSLRKIVDAEGVWVLTNMIVKDGNPLRLACAAFILKKLATDRPNLSQKIANTNMVVARLREYVLMKENASGADGSVVHILRERAADLLQTLVMELRHANSGNDVEPAAKRSRTIE